MTASTWHDAMRRARLLDPDRIARAITALADNGLRAPTYDRDGGRSTAVPCTDEWCEDGPHPHSHPTTPDPTGQAAVTGRPTVDLSGEHRRLQIASRDFVAAANVVLEFVAGKTASTWADVLLVNATLMSGTVKAGIDVDDERILPAAIAKTADAVDRVDDLAAVYLPRDPSEDERHWTSGLADEDCCTWHLQVEPRGRYRRPRCDGKNICQDCVDLVLVAEGAKPPTWLLEAEVERLAKPRPWTQALHRWLDELGLAESA